VGGWVVVGWLVARAQVRGARASTGRPHGGPGEGDGWPAAGVGCVRVTLLSPVQSFTLPSLGSLTTRQQSSRMPHTAIGAHCSAVVETHRGRRCRGSSPPRQSAGLRSFSPLPPAFLASPPSFPPVVTTSGVLLSHTETMGGES